MTQLISWFPRMNTTTIAPTPVIEKNFHPLITLIKKMGDLTKLSQSTLWTLNRHLSIARIDQDDPLRKKINERLKEKAMPILGYAHRSKPVFIKLNSEKSYVQPAAVTIEATKQVLEELVGKLDIIQLCNADDDLIAFIAEKFPYLKSMQIIGCSIQSDDWAFTDKGLESLAQLKQLEFLTLDAWSHLLWISSAGLTKLVNQPHLAAQLKGLRLSTFYVENQTLLAIANYKQLKTLFISADNVEEGLLILTKSLTLRKSLVEFSFESEKGITNLGIRELNKFTSIEHLSMSQTNWDPNNNLEIFLETQKKLKTLSLDGPTINEWVAEKIGHLTELETLQLTNCSQIYCLVGWKLLLKENVKLTHLDVKEVAHLTEEKVSHLAKLSLNYLSKDCCNMISPKWMQTLCESPSLQQSLNTLKLISVYNLENDGYFYLNKLKNLTSLCLIKCSSQFNDDSLKELSEGPISKTLQTLELIGSGINNSLVFLTKFLQLKNFLLGVSYGLTKNNWELLFDNPILRQNLVVFGTDSYDWTEEQLKKLAYFEALKGFVISNDDGINRTDYDVCKRAKEKGLIAYIAWGKETRYINVFEEIIWSLQTHS
jgi:hypothetical protein